MLGLPEAWVGLGIMVALLVDALIDPLVGYLSDHLHSRWGRRHPFMYAAALPVAGAYWLLWSPPAGLSQAQLFAYFVAVAVLVRIFIAFYEIPSASLVPELTDHYDERTSILGFRFFFGWWGGLTMAVLAYVFFLQPDATHAAGVLNPEGYRHYGVAASLIMLAAILDLGDRHALVHSTATAPAARSATGIGGAFRRDGRDAVQPLLPGAVLRRRLRRHGASADRRRSRSTSTRTSGSSASTQMSVLALPLFLSALLAVALAPPLSIRIGKKRAAIAVSLAALLLGPGADRTSARSASFPRTTRRCCYPRWYVFSIASVTLFITSSILTASMVADIVEDSEVATGRRSEGVFVAANMFVQKSVSGIGIFASSLLLGVVGFPRDARPGRVDPAGLRRLGFVYAPRSWPLYAIAIACLSSYRISRASHEENLRRLAAPDA